MILENYGLVQYFSKNQNAKQRTATFSIRTVEVCTKSTKNYVGHCGSRTLLLHRRRFIKMDGQSV